MELIDGQLLKWSEDGNVDLSELTQELSDYRRRIGYSEFPRNGSAYLQGLVAIYVLFRDRVASDSEVEAHNGGPVRVRMQGSEADVFEAFCRKYGVSDALMFIIGRAFDVHSGYAESGVNDGLQPLGVFLAMLDRGLDEHEKNYQSHSLSIALVNALEVNSLRIQEWRQSYYSSLDRGESRQQLRSSPELNLVMEAAKELSEQLSAGKSLAARHLLGALLAYFEGFAGREEPGLETIAVDPAVIRSVLNTHLSLYQETEPLDHWTTVLGSLMAGRKIPPNVGSELHVAREAGSEERCLNVDDYAAALAELFSRADAGEFCFAVYGHWGRGKTFLMKCTEEVLSKLNKAYRVIRFSAWKYPTAPEVWVHLYETIAKEAFDKPWSVAYPNIIRTSIISRGGWGLLRAYGLFAIGLVPFFSRLGFAAEVLDTALLLVGLTGVIWLWSVIHGVQRTGARLAKEYLSPARHAEKLGLQATIGADLQALLAGWMPGKSLPRAFVMGYWAITCIVLIGTFLRLTELGSLAMWRELWGWANVFGWSQWGAGIVDIALAILAFILFDWIQSGGQSPQRILLIVDDLDRCAPQHLLSVMESIKLLIEEPQISCRLQAAMLVEEEILKHAIFEKYGALADPRRSEALKLSYTADRLMRENIEKLFTASLRLPQLSKDDLRAVIRAFAGRGRQIQSRFEAFKKNIQILQDRANDKPSTEMPDGQKPTYYPKIVRGEVVYHEGKPETTFRPATPQEVRHQEESLSKFREKATPILSRAGEILAEMDRILPTGASYRAKEREALRAASIQVLEDDEADAVLQVLADEGIKLRDSLGPRSIRAFLFRYQFARLLLTRLGMDWSATDLARELASQVLTDQSGRADKIPLPINASASADERLRRIVEQVC
ncbi:hypothetical protein XH99_10985 [Bradyrhizobium nanningense]|uniref:KAP NTPase domain-containing protein n=1 Tax=Bradyrhizobium nanningense TaxID=1325118 RepID=A0A4Q0S6N9_9BRAD|nr:hypothetical protein XH99_10985 [Bradyrhizobium nanningense]